MVYHPSYRGNRWRAVRYKAGRMRDVIKNATSLGLALPLSPHDTSKEAFPSYHIKGL